MTQTPGFKEAAVAAVLAGGTPVEGGGWYWGWQDYDAARHTHRGACHYLPTESSELKEITFDEFAGTDATNNHTTVLAVTDVNCVCGEQRGVTVAMQGTTGELLSALLGAPITREYR